MNDDDYTVPTMRRPSLFEGVATFAIVTALLYFGAGIFVPLVLAALLAFALAPVVGWLARKGRLPDPVAVILTVLLALAALGSLSMIAGHQIVVLAQALPGYQETVTDKIAALQHRFSGLTLLEQLQSTVSGLGDRLAERPATGQAGTPLPVTISNEIGPLGLLTSVLGSIIGPVATVAIVAVFLVFLLIGRQDLQDRFIRLVSAGKYSLTSIAIGDASRRVGRYLIIQLVVNILYGTIFGVGLWLIGVPSAPLWGLLIMLFRYIPFVGALIIAVVPFMLAFAVDPGWNMLLWTVALFLLLDLTTANVIEPRLYGSSTGVSPIAILLSAMFWAAIWGPVGLILATPMTVCLVVIGRHLPQMRFFETLLGSEPVLEPPERIYNRLLKGDAEGALAIAEEYIEDHDQTALIKEVMLPALMLAEAERSDEPQALSQRRAFTEGFESALSELAPSSNRKPDTLIIAGHTDLDECAARLLGLSLGHRGVAAKTLPPVAIRQEAIGRIDLEGYKTVVLVFLNGDIRARSRYAARRLKRMAPGVTIIVCALADGFAGETPDTLYVDEMGRSFEDILQLIAERTHEESGGEDRRNVLPAGAGRGDDALGHALDRLAVKFDVPVATIHLLSDERHREDVHAFALTSRIIERDGPLVVDADTDLETRTNLYLQENGIRLFVGVPLKGHDGKIEGVLVLIGYEAREFGEGEVDELQMEARIIMTLYSMQGGQAASASNSSGHEREI